MTDDEGDWLHECKRDKRLDEAGCDWCTHYRAGHQSELIANPTGPFCNLGKPLGPCAHYQREPGADDE